MIMMHSDEETAALSGLVRTLRGPSRMSAGQPTRRFIRVAAGIIVAALIIGSAAYLVSSANKMSTITTTTVVFGTVTATCLTSSTLRCVVFQQLGACSPEFWGVPWSVTIGGTTEVQPTGTKLPIANDSLSGTMDKNLTVIAFSLPDGSYHFRVSPSYEFFTPDSGTVDVNGTNALVQITYSGTSCTRYCDVGQPLERDHSRCEGRRREFYGGPEYNHDLRRRGYQSHLLDEHTGSGDAEHRRRVPTVRAVLTETGSNP